jgi:phytoene dehydrogenase-like protein
MTATTSGPDVAIVGAGLAGLTAARELSRAGLSVTVCETGDDVGGRVRTDRTDGFLLDRGFQVLLPSYPELRRQADLTELRLRPLPRGALAVTPGGSRWLAAPWHSRHAVAGTAAFLHEHPGDVAALAAVSARDLLAPGRAVRAVDPARTTGGELRRTLSAATFEEVMRPFLAGVFLDPSLTTQARLFHLIWRSFLRGGGALPDAGMQELPRQLAAGLPAGALRLRTTISEISDSGIRTSDGEHIRARAVVIATDGTAAARLMPGLARPSWHSVTTFYYRAAAPAPRSPMLVVDGVTGLLINAVVLSAAAPGYAPAGAALVAASVPGRADASLEPRVRTCLARLYQTSTLDWDLLGAYPIPRALPAFPAGQPLRRPVRLGPGRYVCGDHRDTPSIQGALVSGRRAATAVLTDLMRRVVAPQPGRRNSDFRSRGDEASGGLGGPPGGR